jgi:hypothetical protein
MKLIGLTMCAAFALTAAAQDTFSITGAQIPADLVKVNYGKLPKTIQAYDLNICNQSSEKHSLTSSQVYQALVAGNPNLQPIGRQIMMGAVLQNQQRSVASILTVVLNSTVGVLSVLGAARSGLPSNALAGAAVGSALAQQLLNNLKPVLSPDQMQRYESEVLETALLMDSGSCVERTVFAVSTASAKSSVSSLTFHVR